MPPTLPSASVAVDAEAGALAGGTGFLVIFACVALNADIQPRVMGSSKSIISQHGYSPGADYAALHIERTRKPVIFIGLPIVTAGVVGRENDEAVLGTCAISVAADTSGILEEIDGIVTVDTGGTIGTDQIKLSFSADGGRTTKSIRLGTASSYTVPYLGIVLNFGAGSLLAGDEYTFSTTAPKWDSAGIAAAKEALKKQQKLARTWMIIGDLANATEAGYITTAANGYKTSNQRSVKARVSVRDRLPLASKSKIKKQMTGAPSLTFLEVGGTGDTITRGAGSWITDGFVVGDIITVAGSASNNVTGPIASLSATVITLGTTDLANEGPVAGCTVVGGEMLTFAEVGASGDTITRSSGSWLADGFRVGDNVTVAGSVSNNVTGPIASLTATVLTFGTTDLAAETIASYLVTVTKGETQAAYVSAMDAAFATVDAQRRINIGIGRGRLTSEIHGWAFRRPSQWGAAIREYQHDVHIPTWRKADGPLDGVDITDGNGQVVEFDELTDGGGIAGRFTCYRTWANGPLGAFVAMDLTRATDGELLQLDHNMGVVNVAETITQQTTENVIGQVLVLDNDGHATKASLSKIESRINSDLEINLLQEKVVGEGQRASSAVWTASEDDVLNVVDATLTGVLALNLNGTIVHVDTVVKVR